MGEPAWTWLLRNNVEVICYTGDTEVEVWRGAGPNRNRVIYLALGACDDTPSPWRPSPARGSSTTPQSVSSGGGMSEREWVDRDARLVVRGPRIPHVPIGDRSSSDVLQTPPGKTEA